MNSLLIRCQASNIVLPLPSQALDKEIEHAVYSRFMRYLRCVPNSRMEIKILSAIQFTADILDYSDAHVAKVLVDLGLRASRMAFPAEFLEFADASLVRDMQDVGGPNESLLDLQDYWAVNGEDPFVCGRRQYSLLDEAIYAR